MDSTFVCLLNNDTKVLNPNWLTEMVGIAEDKGVGAVGAKLLYPDDTIQHAGVLIGVAGVACHHFKGYPESSTVYFGKLQLLQNFTVVTGACLLVRTEYWHRVKGMATELPYAYNDVDFSMRLDDTGLRNVYSPLTKLYHYESKSRGYENTPEKIKRFSRDTMYMKWRWGAKLFNDRYYNDNLGFDNIEFKVSRKSLFRKTYLNRDQPYYVEVPSGLESVEYAAYPQLPIHPIIGSFKLPANSRFKIMSVLLPFRQMDSAKIESKWRLEVNVQGNDWLATESLSNKKDNVLFNFGPNGVYVDRADRINFKLFLQTNSSIIHLNWFYTTDEYSFKNLHFPDKVIRLILGVRDL
jgi:hypothetical protein